jgi:hypothetical protein
MRSRIAVTATLPVPYRVLRLASAMTAGVDCRCFVVPCCSSCRFLFFRSEPREEPIRAYSCNSWYNIFVPSYARNPICCPLLFFVVLVVVFIFFVPSPARNHLLSFYSSVSPLRKLFPLSSLIVRIKNLLYTIICALVCIITA